MTTNRVIGELPRHLYVFVDSTFTHNEPCGFVPAVWFGLLSQRARAWGCTVMLESGAVFRNLPPHAIAFRKDAEANWSLQKAQRWDCYGEEFHAHEYTYLQGLNVVAHIGVKAETPNLAGRYLFSVAPIGDGFSQYPEQHKEFSFIELDNGRLTIQPTNHLIFDERSFTRNPNQEFPLRDLKRQTEIYRCETITYSVNDNWVDKNNDTQYHSIALQNFTLK